MVLIKRALVECYNILYPSEIHLKLNLKLNFRIRVIYISVDQSFWNVVKSTTEIIRFFLQTSKETERL